MELNFSLVENRELKERLANRLKRYGLEIVPTTNAEVHKEHYPDESKTYVGHVVYVKEIKNPKKQHWVSVWSSRVKKRKSRVS